MEAKQNPMVSPLQGKDTPPVWAAFPVAAFYCGRGWVSSGLRLLVNLIVRGIWGRDSVVLAKLRLTCLTRRVIGLLSGARPGGENPLELAATELAAAGQAFADELLAPVFSLEGKRRLFHEHPPNPKAALEAYEQAMARLGNSPYLATLAKPEHVFFGAAMAATLLRDQHKAREYFHHYQGFVALHPRKSWGEATEKDLAARIETLRHGLNVNKGKAPLGRLP